MKTLQLSYSSKSGGAGIAANRLHRGLQLLEADSWMLVNKINGSEPGVVGPSHYLDKVAAKIFPRLDWAPGKLSKTKLDRVSSAFLPDRLVKRVDDISPDVLNLHWVNDGFMSISTLPKFKYPLVWTLHDMWPFCGGEHYVGDSIRYKEGYLSENRPRNENRLDLHKRIWMRKKKYWSKLVSRMVIAAPSRWMARCAMESALLRDFRVEVLPNGIDHRRFCPVDHAVVRRILGFPLDKKLILFGAGSATSDKRKGYHLLVSAIKMLEKNTDLSDCELVIFGSDSGADNFKMKTHYLGVLADEISLALVYAASDVFVAPSIEDNLPNTVLESLSCGTPVVAFEIGGMPDMISHKKSGFLGSPFSIEELARGIGWVLGNEQRWKKLSASAREEVVTKFTLECSARRYLDLYEGI